MNYINAAQSKNYTKNFNEIGTIKDLTLTQNLLAKQKRLSIDNSVKDLYICHATNFFPEDSIIHPRLGYKINCNPKLKNIFEKLFSVIRPTVHFSLNSIVSEHSEYKIKGNQRFIVIDKLESATNSISGGYIEDIFCIGPYKLSNDATILVPEACKNKKGIQEKIENINRNIKVIYYQGIDKDNFVKWIKNHNASYINPIQQDPDIPNLLCQYGDNRYMNSHSLMKDLKKTYCTHDITPTAQIETYISKTFISEKAPFLQLFEKSNFECIIKNIHDFINSINEVYPLNESQKIFIKGYEKAVFLGLEMVYKAKNLEEIQKNLSLDNDLIFQYDMETDLNNKINFQSATKNLSHIIGLTFTPYFRKNSTTIVDAACRLSLSIGEAKILVNHLNNKTGLDFIIEEHKDCLYMVLKGVNLENISKSIWQLSPQK